VQSDPCCATPSAPFDHRPAGDQQLAALCKALGNPHRVNILRFLSSQRACFSFEIPDQLPIAASTDSQHLTHRKPSGLITGEVDGPRRCYCIDPAVVNQLKTLVAAL
jgi:ArsR family transcriptional regulator, arsenate/arsenite/antimonite-responsive transcriptional repressor